MRTLAAASLACLICASPLAATLTSGPLLGPSGNTSARIWLQADGAARVRIEARRRPTDLPLRADTQLDAAEDFTATVQLDGLTPGQHYAYRVLLDGTEVADGSFTTQPATATPAASFKVLLGSCAYMNDGASGYGGGFEIFDAMAAQKPELMLWLGDNLYLRPEDFASAEGLAARYRKDRSRPYLQKLLRSGEHLAIWDDHDYGPNDSDASFPLKQESLRQFKRYWPNPSFGLPANPGVFTRVVRGDVEFFMLDDRWYRDNDKSPQIDKQMFGAAQLDWLKAALLESKARFKIVASGSQLLNDHNRFEGWNNFPQERQGFLDWLASQRIAGVFLLSGDRHHTELLRREQAGSYPLHELTCSPFTSGTHSVAAEYGKPELVEGTLVGQRNFCALEFSGAGNARNMNVSSFDSAGKLLWSKRFNAAAMAP